MISIKPLPMTPNFVVALKDMYVNNAIVRFPRRHRFVEIVLRDLAADYRADKYDKQVLKQEALTLWTGVEDNGSVDGRNGAWGMRLTMGIAATIVTGLCIGECTYAICLHCPP